MLLVSLVQNQYFISDPLIPNVNVINPSLSGCPIFTSN